eukprot:GEMP01062703.1.p1 GENE.GEMP01062703.1~~GEMP01062703.1.p1  ORF type:complete len:384 (+),score=96.66 GEMP01062703.1:85-1236(+)
MNAKRVRHVENALKLFDESRVTQCVTLPLDLFLRQYFQANKLLKPLDRAWVSEHTYELVRWKGLLTAVTPKPHPWTALMRTYFVSDRWRSHTGSDKLEPHNRCSVPKELFDILEKNLGERGAIFTCNVLNEKATPVLRVNLLKNSRDQVVKFLESKNVLCQPTEFSDMGITLLHKQKLLDLPEYRQGLFEFQDESSQLVAQELKAKAGQKIMDFCAGSGGKTLAFAPQMQNLGQVFLHDVRDTALAQARPRLRKAGIHNYTLLPPGTPLLKHLWGKMDTVLCDVPCSGTGTLRRNPDMKWSFSEEKLWLWVAKQREIFEEALRYMGPKGKILYATSSIIEEENLSQVRFFCEKYGLVLTKEPYHALPQSKAMDGFFVATMERR